MANHEKQQPGARNGHQKLFSERGGKKPQQNIHGCSYGGNKMRRRMPEVSSRFNQGTAQRGSSGRRQPRRDHVSGRRKTCENGGFPLYGECAKDRRDGARSVAPVDSSRDNVRP